MAARLGFKIASLWSFSRKKLYTLGSDTFPSFLIQLLPNDNLHTKPTPWGTSHLLSHAQYPPESCHNLLEMDTITQKSLISARLLILYKTFLSSVWTTKIPQRSIHVLNEFVFSEKNKEIPVFQTTIFLCWEQDLSYSKEN